MQRSHFGNCNHYLAHISHPEHFPFQIKWLLWVIGCPNILGSNKDIVKLTISCDLPLDVLVWIQALSQREHPTVYLWSCCTLELMKRTWTPPWWLLSFKLFPTLLSNVPLLFLLFYIKLMEFVWSFFRVIRRQTTELFIILLWGFGLFFTFRWWMDKGIYWRMIGNQV